MIKRFYVNNVSCLVNFEFRPGRLSLLLGENGSGKTTALRTLSAVRDFVIGKHDVDRLFPRRTLTRWQSAFTQTFELELDGEYGSYRYRLEVDHDKDVNRRRVARESLTLDGFPLYESRKGEAQLFKDSYDAGPKVVINWSRSGVGELNEYPTNKKLTWFKERMRRLYVLSIDPVGMQAVSSGESDDLDPRMENFVSWYRSRLGADPAAASRFFDSLSQVLPGFRQLVLKGGTRDDKLMQVEFEADQQTRPGQSSLPFDFNEVSDGQRSLIALYSLIHFIPEDATICIDEPDNFVALREIQPWLHEVVDRTSGSRSQFLLVSHHPELVNYLARSNGLLFGRANSGCPVLVRGIEEEDLKGLDFAETMARGWQGA